MSERRIRVLLAKVGLDGHDRGVRIVARALLEAGMEVIYLGLRSTPEAVARAALEEDADAVGLSFLAGDHMVLAPKVMAALAACGRGGLMVLAGGIIPARDVAQLERIGVRRVFPPGTPPDQIAQFITQHAGKAEPAAATR